MLITIITVCFNCEDKIRDTIESLRRQTFQEFEYIVIDGKSTDATFQIVQEYLDIIPNMKTLSEPDHGIYDAMNKAVKMARGEYVYFLNAGDAFYDDDVLQQAVQHMHEKKDIYYGNTKLRSEGRIEYYPAKLTKFFLIYREKMICHQSIIAKRELLLKNPLETKFKLCGDRNWLITSLREDATYQYWPDIIIGDYEGGGDSDIHGDPDSFIIARRCEGEKAVVFIRCKRFVGKVVRSVFGKQV